MELQAKIMAHIEIKGSNGMVYQFIFPANSPLGESYDAAYAMLDEITRQMKIASEAKQKKENND